MITSLMLRRVVFFFKLLLYFSFYREEICRSNVLLFAEKL